MSSRSQGNKKGSALLRDLVAQYRKLFTKEPDSWAEYTAAQGTTAQAARVAASALNERGVKHDHQRRLKGENLYRFGQAISQRSKRIDKAETFDELYDLCREAKVPGVGDLAIYDTAYRIGAKANPKIEPDKVYLHRGTFQGAKRYGLVKKWQPYLTLDELPNEFKGLTPHQVEAFLCIYKDGRLFEVRPDTCP